jgi:uncharacterized membrane protein
VYQFLNIFLIAFHTALIIFNLIGWIWKKTRPWNLATLLLTGLSWTVLGIWYGLGFCPFTQWQFEVRQHLGYTNMPNSYIQFLVKSLTNLHLSNHLVFVLTGAIYVILLLISLWVNLQPLVKKRLLRMKK